MSRNNNRNKGHRDAKQLSRNRFAALDPDISGRFDDDDDFNPSHPRRGGQQGNTSNFINRTAGAVLHGRGKNDRNNVNQRQNMRGAAGNERNNVMVYKIRAPKAKAVPIDWLLRQLNQQVEDLKPILPASDPNTGDITFYVKSEDTAESIKQLSRRIVYRPTNEKVFFVVNQQVAPWTRLKPDEESAIHTSVDARFSAESRALDLSEFASSPLFVEKKLLLQLSKNNVMLSVADRIDEKYGVITALSLQNNRLRYLDCAASLVPVAKFVKVLDLSHNQIDRIEELAKLKGMPVETLFFEGNPLCERLNDATEYLNAIQKIFPRVVYLDGLPVPPCTTMPSVDDEDVTEPAAKPGFCPSDAIQQLIGRFIEAYFEKYDSADPSERKNLMAAYDDNNATFTYTFGVLSNPMGGLGDCVYDTEVYRQYLINSHNIEQEEKWKKSRSSRVYRGAMDIAVQLAKMPASNHYRESFVTDVSMMTANLLCFSVQGLFEDAPLASQGEVPKLRYFVRNFVAAPRNGGNSLALLSDMLCISAINTKRVERYKLQMNKANSAAQTAPQQPTVPAAIGGLQAMSVAAGPSDDVKRQMVEQFCRQSGMLPEWSAKCLEDSNWNYEMAGQLFTDNRAAIPAEAFATAA